MSAIGSSGESLSVERAVDRAAVARFLVPAHVHERGLGVEALAVGRRADLEVEVDLVLAARSRSARRACPCTSASAKPMRSKRACTWSPSTSIATPPIFFGSPYVSRPPIVACSVVIGMNSAYSPSTVPCRARTPNQPAPNTGMPVPMSTVAKRMRASGSDGSSGGGSTAGSRRDRSPRRRSPRSTRSSRWSPRPRGCAAASGGARVPNRSSVDRSAHQALMTCSGSNALQVESAG